MTLIPISAYPSVYISAQCIFLTLLHFLYVTGIHCSLFNLGRTPLACTYPSVHLATHFIRRRLTRALPCNYYLHWRNRPMNIKCRAGESGNLNLHSLLFLVPEFNFNIHFSFYLDVILINIVIFSFLCCINVLDFISFWT